ncbi:MAG: phage head-tail connector protein [Atopobiaceae bacterium]|nr:phage head-tail connector protein [Atopobiaceae bacterium]
MSLLDDVRTALRVTTTLTDGEIGTYIGTALFDIENKGVKPEFLAEDADADNGDYMPIVKTAVINYCKAQYGRDVEASERNACIASYNSIVASLLNGKQNVHYATDDEVDG